MRTNVFACWIYTLLGIASIAAFSGLSSGPACASTIIVHPGGTNVIGSAVQASSSGDSILVMPGLYALETGSIISHSLTIVGVGGANSTNVLACSNQCLGYLFRIEGAAPSVVTIEGLKVSRLDQFAVDGVQIATQGAAIIRNCIIHNVLNQGVIIYSSGAIAPRIEDSVFYGTETAISVRQGTAIIRGNSIASSFGIGLRGDGTAVFANNVIAYANAGISCDQSTPSPTFTCNNVWNNTPFGNYPGCADPTGTNGNISVDPLFCDSESDLRLRANSPCLPPNAPAGCGLIGALGSCVTTSIEEPELAPAMRLISIESNPVSQAAVFLVHDPRAVTAIEIYDPNGRQVAALQPDAGRIQWLPSDDQGRGVYFARAVTNAQSEVVKFVLIR